MFRNKESSMETTPDIGPKPAASQPSSQTPTLLASGAEIRGDLKAPGAVVVEGTIEGSINATGDVQIGPRGNVTAEIEGRNVTVAGRVKGKIFAEDKVMLVSGAHVEGDIHSQSLKIEDAVFFQGGCVMGEGARKRRADKHVPLPETIRKAA